jgi:ubiquinone/menaquinone biosynthesis C-methylase UbiE
MTSRNNLAGLLTVLITTVVLQGLLLAAGQQEPTNDYRHGGRSEHSFVADVGAGTGYFAARFSRAVGPAGTVLAADIEPGMVAYLRRRAEREGHANLIPILASADNPRLPDRAVDLVFFCNTWHHIGDRVAYARRLRDDLARGGRVVVVDFLPGDLPVGPPPTEKLGESEVVAEFENAGFQRVHSLDFLPYQYVLVFQASPGS